MIPIWISCHCLSGVLISLILQDTGKSSQQEARAELKRQTAPATSATTSDHSHHQEQRSQVEERARRHSDEGPDADLLREGELSVEDRKRMTKNIHDAGLK